MKSYSHWGMFPVPGPAWEPIGWNSVYHYADDRIYSYDARYLHDH